MARNHWARHQGQKFWGIITQVANDEEGDTVFVWADRMEVVEGSLLVWGSEGELNAGLSPGNWRAFFQASVEDGGAVLTDRPIQDMDQDKTA